MPRPGAFVVLTAAVLLTDAVAAQRKPDFSGTWTLVDMVDRGPGRGGGARSGAAAKVSDIAGTLVNCASECTIVQTDTTLTVSRPPNVKGVVPPPIAVNLDGRPTPGRTLTVRWDGDKLVITRAFAGAFAVTQTLTLQDGKLTVHDVFSMGDVGPITLTYEKRKKSQTGGGR
jgi:hypothetical protein